MFDTDTEKVLTIIRHIVERRDDIRRPDVATAESRGTVVDSRHAVDFFVTHLASDRITKRRFDFSRQVVPCAR